MYLLDLNICVLIIKRQRRESSGRRTALERLNVMNLIKHLQLKIRGKGQVCFLGEKNLYLTPLKKQAEEVKAVLESLDPLLFISE